LEKGRIEKKRHLKLPDGAGAILERKRQENLRERASRERLRLRKRIGENPLLRRKSTSGVYKVSRKNDREPGQRVGGVR